MKDADKVVALYKVDGLFGLVKKYYPQVNDKQSALLMEFVLHGLAAFSLINKKMIDGKIEFNDLMSSMMNLGSFGLEEDDYNESDYQ
jgi:magnesium chelatase subunit I